MKIVSISDTHGYHDSIAMPKGDIVIHAGDCTPRIHVIHKKILMTNHLRNDNEKV